MKDLTPKLAALHEMISSRGKSGQGGEIIDLAGSIQIGMSIEEIYSMDGGFDMFTPSGIVAMDKAGRERLMTRGEWYTAWSAVRKHVWDFVSCLTRKTKTT